MALYIVRRLLYSVPLLLGLIFLVFLLLQLTPGDPLQAIVGQYPVPQAFRDSLVAKYHLDEPFLSRFWYFLKGVLRGDLGYSFVAGAPVGSLILDRFPNTLLLAASGFALGIAAGGVVGIISGTSRKHWVDPVLTTTVLTAYAVPIFWMGQLLVIVFALRLGWLPTQGMSPAFSDAQGFGFLVERARYLALPMLTYAIYEAAKTARIARISVLETVNQGFITTARLKGLSRRQIITRHVIRNASLPVVSAMGYSFAGAMGGSVLIETVFSWPGIGLLLIEGVRQHDNQVVIGVVLFIGVAVVVMNLLVDIANAWLDPRIKR